MDPRYDAASGRYRPETVRVLFIKESPPYARDRHFYFLGVRAHDGLFINLTRFLYGSDFSEDTAAERAAKDRWLLRYQADGYFAMDAVSEPVAKHSQDERIEIIRAAAPAVVEKVRSLAPQQIVLVKRSVHDGLDGALRAAGMPVVNDGPVPYPGRGQQGRFTRALEELVASGRLRLAPRD